MKRLLSIVVAITMGVSCFGMYTSDVSAAQNKESNRYLIDRDKTEAEYKEGEALVVFKTSGMSPKTAVSDFADMNSDVEIESVWSFETETEAVEGKSMKRLTGVNTFLNVALVKSAALTTKQLISKMEKQKDVEYAEPNYKIKALSSDTYFNKQWNLKNTGQNGGTSGKSTNVESKWDKGIKGSDEAVVAVIDTGVYYPHEDLKDNMWQNTFQPQLKGDCGFDFVNNDSDPIDDNGHGTHCAGIIGAAGDNGIGISGVNQDVKIMALKILDHEGSGWVSDEVSAYHYIHKAMNLGVNVVAVNNSWGGGGSSLFADLIEVVGEKGAVTVCAAGNESNNNDNEEDYPVNIDSPYLLSVAASNEDNELADFSNYGATTVDLAAPGTDILSTVSYDSYNPSLYDGDKQSQLSDKFTAFTGVEAEWDLLSEAFIPESLDEQQITVSNEANFGEAAGKSLKLDFNAMKAGDTAYIKIPYTLGDEYDADVHTKLLSLMAKVAGPESVSDGLLSFGSGIFFVYDQAKRDSKVDLNVYEPDDLYGTYITGEANYWDHFELISGNYENDPGNERELVVGMYAFEDGDFHCYIDDLGISQTVSDTSVFGKYDFYNGTSMAAPHVTGAVALLASEYPDADASGLIDAVLTHIRTDENLENKVCTDGVLDFSSTKELAPRIASAEVDIESKEIIISGGGFSNVSDVKVNGTSAEVISTEGNKLKIKGDNWINKIVDIAVTGGGKTVTKENVYLVDGKTGYTEMDELFEFPSDSCSLTADVKNMYAADSNTDTIYVANTTDGKYMEFEELAEVDPAKYFTKDKESLAKYDFAFGKDLVYADGKLYSIVSYSETGADGSFEDDDIWSNSYYIEDDDLTIQSMAPTAFSSQYKLMSFDVKSGVVKDLGELDPSLAKIEDCTLATYNGKVYVIGGYDYSTKDLTTKVMIYDPSKKNWSKGPELPEGRAEGKAIQSGDALVYTLGYGTSQKGTALLEQNCPANLILKNGKWTLSTVETAPYYIAKEVTRNGVSYAKFDGTVGICKEGLIYAGIPTEGLGDTFVYDVSKDKYTPTKYQFINMKDNETFTGVMVGNTLYGYDSGEYCHKVKISNGQVKVTPAKSYSGGTIKGTNTNYLPGTKITVKAVPKSGYYVKSFYLDGNKVSGTSKTIRITKNQVAKASFGKYVTKITLNKSKITLKDGKKYTLKAKVSPSNATNKAVTYKSSNTKYATVSSKGVIKAKRAGRGKTVTITVTAKDGSKVKAKCKVKIVD